MDLAFFNTWNWYSLNIGLCAWNIKREQISLLAKYYFSLPSYCKLVLKSEFLTNIPLMQNNINLAQQIMFNAGLVKSSLSSNYCTLPKNTVLYYCGPVVTMLVKSYYLVEFFDVKLKDEGDMQTFVCGRLVLSLYFHVFFQYFHPLSLLHFELEN